MWTIDTHSSSWSCQSCFGIALCHEKEHKLGSRTYFGSNPDPGTLWLGHYGQINYPSWDFIFSSFKKNLFIYFKKNFINLFIFGSAGSLLLHGLFSSCSKWSLLSGCSVWASHCGFSFCGAGALGHTGFGSCGLRAQ